MTAKVMALPSQTRTPPHNFDAEMMLLGGVVGHERGLELVRQRVTAEMFADDRHGRIWDACCALADRGEVVNPIKLKTWAERQGADTLRELGGTTYLARLAGAVVTIVNLTDYADTVAELWRRRRLIDCIESAGGDLYGCWPERTSAVIMDEMQQRVAILMETASDRPIATVQQSIMAATEAADQARKGNSSAIPTGFVDLDRMLGGGVERGQVVFLGARPSMGKTSWALWAAYHMAKAGRKVLVQECEMTDLALGRRLAAGLCNLDIQAVRAGKISDNDFARLLEVSRDHAKFSMWFDARAGLSVQDIRARAKQVRRRHGLDVVFVDHLALLRGPPGIKDKTQEIESIARAFRPLAKELGIALIVLAQLNRAVEGRDDKRPSLADLRQSGAIEEEADAVLFLYREHYYLNRERPQRRQGENEAALAVRTDEWRERCAKIEHDAEINIAKQRDGATGTIHLHYTAETARFRNAGAPGWEGR